MPKPPTAQRGRRPAPEAPVPPPRRRSVLSRPKSRLQAPPREAIVDDLSRVTARMVIAVLASLAGLGVASYLTLAHYTHVVSLACPNTGAINCEAVTTSAESIVFGVPVAVLGLVYFAVMFGLSLLWRSPNRFVAPLRLGAAVTGMGFVFYLLYAELYEIGKICLWCTSVHVLTFVVFITVVTGWAETTAYAEVAAERD